MQMKNSLPAVLLSLLHIVLFVLSSDCCLNAFRLLLSCPQRRIRSQCKRDVSWPFHRWPGIRRRW